MAIAVAYLPMDMFAEPLWFGTITSASETGFIVTDGFRTAQYYGDFTYVPSPGFPTTGFPIGTVSGIREWRGGDLYYSISGADVPFSTLFNSGDYYIASRYLFADSDTFNGSDGDENVWTFDGDDRVNAGLGNDSVDGGLGNDTIYGEAGDDVLHGGAGDDVLIGGEGADFILGGDTTSVPEGDGNDYADGGPGDDTINGGTGADIIIGGAGNDVLQGGTDNDIIAGGSGADVMHGGEGADIFAYVTGDDTMTITDFEPGVDCLALFDIGVDFTTEDLAPLVSQEGNDVVIRSGSQEVRLEDTTLAAWSTDDVFIAKLFLGDDLSNTLEASGGADAIFGLGGEDWLFGRDGNDWLFGGIGNDWLTGGAGADKLDGGSGKDRADYSNATSLVRADLADGSTNTGEAAGDSYISVENLKGSDFGDVLAGNDEVNSLWGGDGSDQLFGRGGNDWLDGEAGNDTVDGGAGNDIIIGGQGVDLVTGDAGADVFAFFEFDDTIIITDFEAGVDDLALVNFDERLTVEGLVPYVSQDGNDVVIAAGTQEVRFVDTQLSELGAHDVIFVQV
jgi:Ca2+-binding RTX toxin-like protein